MNSWWGTTPDTFWWKSLVRRRNKTVDGNISNNKTSMKSLYRVHELKCTPWQTDFLNPTFSYSFICDIIMNFTCFAFHSPAHRLTDALVKTPSTFSTRLSLIATAFSIFPLYWVNCLQRRSHLYSRASHKVKVKVCWVALVSIHTDLDEMKTKEKRCRHSRDTNTHSIFYVVEFMLHANSVYTVKASEPCPVTTLQPYRLNITNSYAVKSIKIPKESTIRYAV